MWSRPYRGGSEAKKKNPARENRGLPKETGGVGEPILS